MQWYAIYTKPKREDIVAESLVKAGLDVYNPKLKQKRYLQGSYKDVVGPLFPSYIFVRFEPETFSWMIRYTRGVRRIVGGDSPWPLSEDVIDFIRSHEEEGVITVKPPDLKCGDRVTIKDGPLQGLNGIFEKEISGDERVVLLLTAVEYQARVIIEKAFLTKAA